MAMAEENKKIPFQCLFVVYHKSHPGIRGSEAEDNRQSHAKAKTPANSTHGVPTCSVTHQVLTTPNVA
jgi:hypothetical protein